MATLSENLSDEEKQKQVMNGFATVRQDIGYLGQYLQQMAALCTELGKNQQLVFNAYQQQAAQHEKLTAELAGLSRRLDYIIDKLMREHDDN